MDDVGWSALIIGVFVVLSLFFSLNGLALRTFSRVKLQEAFKNRNKEDKFEAFVENSETLTMLCLFYRLIADIVVIVFFAIIFAAKGHILSFAVSVTIFKMLCLAIPHPWSKYTGETLLATTS